MASLDFRGKPFVRDYYKGLPHHTLVPNPELSVVPAVVPAGQVASEDAAGTARGGTAAPSLNEPYTLSINENLIIEGDNLLALQALLPFYEGKIRCIFIDPPYNTGNEHWVYNDNVSSALFKEWLGKEVGPQGEDFNRHDKWCCMMWPRLQLLKQLLRSDGIIFISIDDNEIAHLRLLMDEIFGEASFIATCVWQKRYSRENREAIGDAHEYIVIYALDPNNFKKTRHLIPPSEDQTKIYRNTNNDPRGRWRGVPMTAQGYRENQMYPITTPSGVVHLPPEGRCWSMTEPEFLKLLESGRIYFGKDNCAQPAVIRYLTEFEGLVPWTWWPHEEVGHTDEAKKQIQTIFGTQTMFDTPKPTRLIQRIVRMVTDDGDFILDSFAGSATTAQAVLEMNAEDGGDRHFILVQMPFDNKDDERAGKNIARSVTRERVKRVIEGIEDNVPPLGGSFTYCTLSDEPLKQYYGMLRSGISWAELAGYIWMSETHHAIDISSSDPQLGRIGQRGDLVIYLLYSADPEDSIAFDRAMLNQLEQEPGRIIVVYCEKNWVDKEILAGWAHDHRKTIQPRLLPIQLR